MIKIKPSIEHASTCPYCGDSLVAKQALWQGIHIAVISDCVRCHVEIVEDLPIGQAIFTPYQLNLNTSQVFGEQSARTWFGVPFLNSLQNPDEQYIVKLQVEKKHKIDSAVILNCVDYLYGHSLLKLLNADLYQQIDSNRGLIVIVPSYLRWMVPNYVAEVWEVNIPLSLSKHYFPKFHAEIEHQLTRFNEVFISPAHSHPKNFEIFNFTGFKPKSFIGFPHNITFVWREDRIWANTWLCKILKTFKLDLFWQNYKVTSLFNKLRKSLPETKFSVIGLGSKTNFPCWINDLRVDFFDYDSEKAACNHCSKSDLVIGVHGSNMLIPSAHSWAVIDLMPSDRWPNMSQDILYQVSKVDVRMVSWRYRFLPLETSVKQVSLIAKLLLLYAKKSSKQFTQVD